MMGSIVVDVGSMVIAGEAKLKRLQRARQISERINSYRTLLWKPRKIVSCPVSTP